LQLVLKLKFKIPDVTLSGSPDPKTITPTHSPTLGSHGVPRSSSLDGKYPSSTSPTRASSNQLGRSYTSIPHQGGETPSSSTWKTKHFPLW